MRRLGHCASDDTVRHGWCRHRRIRGRERRWEGLCYGETGAIAFLYEYGNTAMCFGPSSWRTGSITIGIPSAWMSLDVFVAGYTNGSLFGPNWVTMMRTWPSSRYSGDANGDGTVNGADLTSRCRTTTRRA